MKLKREFGRIQEVKLGAVIGRIIEKLDNSEDMGETVLFYQQIRRKEGGREEFQGGGKKLRNQVQSEIK